MLSAAPPFSIALSLSSILFSALLPAAADISGLTPCKESKGINKLESSLKLYAPDSDPTGHQQALEDEERSLVVMGRLAEQLLTPQSAAREYLAEKLVGEGKKMVVEGKKLGLEVLHIDIEVDIAYQKVYLDNLP